MPLTASTIRSLSLDLVFDRDEDADVAMRRIDHAETDAVCRHLLGDLLAAGLGPASRSAGLGPASRSAGLGPANRSDGSDRADRR